MERMMNVKLGMYSAEMNRTPVEEAFAAMKGYGFEQVQFDFRSVCPEQMPRVIDPALVKEIQRQALAHGIEITAINGTFNMIHPDHEMREEGCRRFEGIARASDELGCRIVTLCTGSRNASHMWSWHEDNLTPSAWEDLITSMERVLTIAERYNVILGIETEPSNCVNTPERTRLLLDTFGSPSLGVIMDIANLFQVGEAKRENVWRIIDHAFELLGKDICLAHGKDILQGEGLEYTYAGNGIVDFGYFLRKLDEVEYTGGIILHGIKDEAHFPKAVEHVQSAMQNK